MPQYSEKNFAVTVEGNTVIYSGVLEKSDYTEITGFLNTFAQSLSDELCCIDLKALRILNSSGLQAMVKFMLKVPQKIEIRINKQISWQTKLIPSLVHLRPGRITVLE